MLFTLYYMAATWLQSWRLGSLRARLKNYLSSDYSIVLYKMPENVLAEQDITGPCLVTSLNMSSTRVCEVLQLEGPLRLCTLFPSQKLFITNWIAARDYVTVDIEVPSTSDDRSNKSEDDLKLLIEAQLNEYNYEECEKLDLQRYGSLIAWHFGKTFNMVLSSTLQQLTELTQKFLKGNVFINGGLELLRIETVDIDGKPKNIRDNDRTRQCISQNILTSDNLLLHASMLKELSDSASDIESNVKLKDDAKSIELVNDLPGTSYDAEAEQIDSTDHVSRINSEVVLENPVDKPQQKKTGIQEPEVELSNNEQEKIVEKTVIKTTSSPKILKNGAAKVLKEPVLTIRDLEQRPVQSDAEISQSLSQKITGSPKNVTFKNQSEISGDAVGSKTYTGKSKPPNILVFSESLVAIDNVKTALKSILQKNKYTIYTLTKSQVTTDTWMDNALLVIACGTVSSDVAPRLLNYLLRGGKLLCLCSDLIHTVLPTYKTAEVREHELVRFSYGRWQNVRMMHHIFCYQASPARKHFSHDSIDEGHQPQSSVQPRAPSSIEVRDSYGRAHKLSVEVLGAEETWHTPSLLLATTLPDSSKPKTATYGRAVFSQVHLEVDPNQYESEEAKYIVLKESNEARLEILRDILGKHLSLQCSEKKADSIKSPVESYTPAYFLGRHDLKLNLLKFLEPSMTSDQTLKTSKLTLRFCGLGETPPPATQYLLPIRVHSCPDNFSTIEYFGNLKSEQVGRLVIYSSVMTSSQDVLSGIKLHHGVVVIPRFQTKGSGRSANQWLSPDGCAMFSVQLHVASESPLGQRAPVVQHLVATAVVSAVLSIPGYENLDIGLKWPNDIYAHGAVKIGGLVVTSTLDMDTTVCNVGCGINLDNSDPTTCINDVIKKYNADNGTDLPTIGYEKFLALVCSEIETIFKTVQAGDIDYLYDLYYKYWLHNNANIVVMDEASGPTNVVVHGIDDFGFLLVRYPNRKLISVHPDGNSFDMLRGLIVPKIF